MIVGELFDKNNATFRCYDNISQAKYYVPPHPLKNLLTRGLKNEFFALLTDSRGARKHRALLSRAAEHHQDPIR